MRDSARPVASPDDDSVVANACESRVYNLTANVQLRDRFWIKGSRYSVLDMLAQDPLAACFAGGTIYQAFLTVLSYHRWHSPVSGTVVRAFVQDGTYFSEPLFEPDGPAAAPGPRGMSAAQGYLSAMATRAVIIIDADNPAIGLVAFIGIGIDEVSTCEITVAEGQHVNKGDQTGMFHFGGSSHVLLFRKGRQARRLSPAGPRAQRPGPEPACRCHGVIRSLGDIIFLLSQFLCFFVHGLPVEESGRYQKAAVEFQKCQRTGMIVGEPWLGLTNSYPT